MSGNRAREGQGRAVMWQPGRARTSDNYGSDSRDNNCGSQKNNTKLLNHRSEKIVLSDSGAIVGNSINNCNLNKTDAVDN